MKKDIKKLISEAFDELYNEMVNEAPTIKKAYIPDEDVNTIIQNSLKRGTPVPNDFDSTALKSRENFDKIIDALAYEYKTTGNPKAKAAIQASFFPSPKSKMQRTVGMKFLGNPELEDAAASAYEQVVIDNFDKILNSYIQGSRKLGAMFITDMRNKVYNYIVKGYRGAGGGSMYDVVGGQEKALSMDEPLGDDENSGTFGDKLAGIPDSSKTAMEKGFAKEKAVEDKKNILQNVIAWLDNTFEEEGNEMGKKRMIAFKGILNGETPQEIFEDNPGVFKEPRLIMQEFERLVNSPEAQEISKLISQIHGINFNLANIDPKKLKQTSSMNPDFGGFSKVVSISTPEMKDAQQELNNALAIVGLKSTDMNSERKKEEVIQKLQASGQHAELENILDAYEDLLDVTEKARKAGEFDAKTALLPSSPEEEIASGEKMYERFEGFSMEKLMERVYKRLSK